MLGRRLPRLRVSRSPRLLPRRPRRNFPGIALLLTYFQPTPDLPLTYRQKVPGMGRRAGGLSQAAEDQRPE